MATQFQNRLIGTVILVALGVAFIPDLLMGKKNDVSAPAGSIPLHPETTAQQSGSLPIQTAPQLQPGQAPVSAAQPQHAGQAVVATNTTSAAGAATINNPSGISAPGTAVVATGNSGNTTTVVGGTPATASTGTANAHPAQNNNAWGVQEVAPAVTVGTQQADTSAGKPVTAAVNVQQQQQKALADQQARQQAALLAAQKRAQQQQLALQKKKEQEAQQAMAILNASPATEKPETATIQEPRKDDGLTVMTPEQVASLRAHKTTTPATSAHTNTAPVQTESHAAAPAAAASGSWVVQVGVFSSSVNANSLAGKLRSAGVSATTQRWGQLTRVIVGPSASREQLQSMLPRINSASGIAGRVVPYTGH